MRYCQLCTHKINMNDLTWESDLCCRTGNQLLDIGYPAYSKIINSRDQFTQE